MLAGGPLDPLAFGQPDFFSGKAARRVHRLGDRRGHHLSAEDVFTFVGVGGVGLRPVVIERMEKSDAGVVSATRLGVEVGLERIAKLPGGAQDRRVRFGIGPDAALGVGVLGGVRAQNWTEGAELDPAGVEFRVHDARHMAADVVAPIGVTHIGRSGCEPGLKLERGPHRNRVAGEADLVAMIAQSAPAVEEQRTLAFALLIGEVKVVQPPGWIHVRHVGGGLLLPVQPPEIDALLFQRMEHEIEVIRRPKLVGGIEGDVLLRRRIDAHRLRHGGVGLLPGLNARGGMQVQRHLQTLIVELAEKGVRIGKQKLVPRVSGPAERLAGLIGCAHRLELLAVDVPVHVDYGYVERGRILVKALDELVHFLVAVGPVARPPGAKGETRRQRNAAGNAHVVAKGFAVVVTVAEEVPVNIFAWALVRGTFHDPRPRAALAIEEAEVGRIEERARGVVDQRPS